MTVGQRIKSRRKELGISADALADVLGVSRSTIFRYESGYIEKLPADALDPIAHALSTSVPYLLGFDENSSEVRSAVPYFLSLPEEKLIQLFRKVPEEDQPLVLGMIQAAVNINN